MAEQFYHLRIKKQYASAIIEDLQQVDAIEIMEEPVAQWQQDESVRRLDNMKKNPSTTLDENSFFNDL
jgi:hypothetical protein